MKHLLTAVALAGATFLAGCEDEADEARSDAQTGGEAAGEIIGGTISDEMLPLEQLTSTSPPAQDQPDDEDAPEG